MSAASATGAPASAETGKRDTKDKKKKRDEKDKKDTKAGKKKKDKKKKKDSDDVENDPIFDIFKDVEEKETTVDDDPVAGDTIADEPKPIDPHVQKTLDMVKNFRKMDVVSNLVRDMIKAADLDRQMCKRGEVPVKKLRMLHKAIDVLSKEEYFDLLVEHGIGRAIAKWLQPHPGGQLPNDQLRSQMLRALARLPINKEHVKLAKDPSLGGMMLQYYKNKDETEENRNIAGSLIEKWTKEVILGLDKRMQGSGSSDDRIPLPPPDDRVPLPPKPQEAAGSVEAMERKSARGVHPKVPEVGDKKCAIRPASTDDPTNKDGDMQGEQRQSLAKSGDQTSTTSKTHWQMALQRSVSGTTIDLP